MEKIRIEVDNGITIEVDEKIAKKAILSMLGLCAKEKENKIEHKYKAYRKDVDRQEGSLAQKLYELRQSGLMPKDIAAKMGLPISKVNYSIANYKGKLKREGQDVDISKGRNQNQPKKLDKYDKIGKLIIQGQPTTSAITNVLGRNPCGYDYFMLRKLGYID